MIAMSSKKELLAEAIAKAVGAGKPAALETVDFSDPDRPKTCLEVDFPILPINQIAIIEGNAGKPIYQMSKWWARRRSSVFRSMLIAAAAKAPEDKSHAAKLVWDNYYANHQKKGAFNHLKVADIFMGGGTTLVEGSRLGMQMFGNDLNPVAWFVVKQELAQVDLDEVKRLLADIEAEVKPQIMPFYYCDGPNGEKGTWTHIPTGRVEGPNFDPLALTPEQRKDYRYEGPEIIYTFWAKHGPCQVTGCGHRTPIMSSPVMAVKTLTVKHWPYQCGDCDATFDIESKPVRMAPDVVLFINPEETPFATLSEDSRVRCPHCQAEHKTRFSPKDGLVIEGPRGQTKLGKGRTKKVEMTLLVHPQWLAGSSSFAPLAQDESIPPFAKGGLGGIPHPAASIQAEEIPPVPPFAKGGVRKAYGGSAQDDAESTALWNQERASKIRLLEVRGELQPTVKCPETRVIFKTGKEGGTAKPGYFACGACGTVQKVVDAIRPTGKTAPFAAYGVQALSPSTNPAVMGYGGRFFAPVDDQYAKQMNAATEEWEKLKDAELCNYWPRSAVPESLRATVKDVITDGHGFFDWYTLFNPRQLLVNAHLLKAIATAGNASWDARECVLGAFQQYLRNQNMFCFWDIGYDKLVPHMSRNSYHTKNNVVENCVFGSLGRGNWTSCVEGIIEGLEWARLPWETISLATLEHTHPQLAQECTGKSEKAWCNDALSDAVISQGSSTDLNGFSADTFDLVITDPPFGDLVQYAELADFFYMDANENDIKTFC